jgi:hypothetical protein
LSCVVDEKLMEHRLHAGDLMLRFEHVIVRQISLAAMALRRMPIEKWLAQHQRLHARFYGAASASPATIHSLGGFAAVLPRRKRFTWMRWIDAEIFTCALHDVPRDKLLLLSGRDRAAIEKIAGTIGWADR